MSSPSFQFVHRPLLAIKRERESSIRSALINMRTRIVIYSSIAVVLLLGMGIFQIFTFVPSPVGYCDTFSISSPSGSELVQEMGKKDCEQAGCKWVVDSQLGFEGLIDPTNPDSQEVYNGKGRSFFYACVSKELPRWADELKNFIENK